MDLIGNIQRSLFDLDSEYPHTASTADVTVGSLLSLLTYFFIHPIVSNLLTKHSKQYAQLDAAQQLKFDGFVLSGINASYTGLLSLFKLLTVGSVSPLLSISLLTSINGYFLHDTWATRSVWLKTPDNVIHHIAGVLMCSAILCNLDANQEVLPYVNLVAIAELSTIFLDIGWIARKLLIPQVYITVCDFIFVGLFFFLRILLFPHTVYVMAFETRVNSIYIYIAEFAHSYNLDNYDIILIALIVLITTGFWQDHWILSISLSPGSLTPY